MRKYFQKILELELQVLNPVWVNIILIQAPFQKKDGDIIIGLFDLIYLF
jgi:hypothetical protein